MQFTDVQEELGQIRGVSFEWNGAGVVRPLRRADSYGCGKWLGNCDLPERRIQELVTGGGKHESTPGAADKNTDIQIKSI